MLKIFNLDSFMTNDLEVSLSNIYGYTEIDSELISLVINSSFRSEAFITSKREKIDVNDFISYYRVIKKNIVEVVKKKKYCEVLISIRDFLIIGNSRVLRI